MKRFWCLALLAMIIVLPQGVRAAEELTYSGSTTIGKGVLEEGAVKSFESKTGIKFKSIEYVGSAKGVENLVNGRCTIAGTSRALKDPEKKKGLVGYIIGYDAVGVYINKNNPIKSLSNEQLKGIFSGKIKNWKEVGGKNAPVVALIQDSKRATMEVFQEAVMSHSPFGDGFKVIDLPTDLLREVARNEGAIAPVSLGLLGSLSETERVQVKALTVGAVEATEKNVRSGAYKVSRPLILAVKGVPKGEIKQFIDFMLSKEGQAITGKNFVALRK